MKKLFAFSILAVYEPTSQPRHEECQENKRWYGFPAAVRCTLRMTMDGDGISDGVELSHAAQGYDPLTWDNAYADDDRDGLSVFEEFLLGTDPTVADAPPTYPSAEASDYLPLTLRIGAAGKLPDSLNANCALCHNVTVRVGAEARTCPRSSRDRGPVEVNEILYLLRGTNYAVHVSI